jgi:YfiH family protein
MVKTAESAAQVLSRLLRVTCAASYHRKLSQAMKAKSHKQSSRNSSPKKERSSVSIEVLRAKSFASLPWLVHGFSTRKGGVSNCYGKGALNLGLTKDDDEENVVRNRALFLEALGPTDAGGHAWPVVPVKQIHSSIIHRVNASPASPPACDGLITNTPGLLLTVRTADCVPILVVDAKRKAVGAFHAGWRGTAARIVEKGIGEMRRQFGSDPRNLRAVIGPCIRRCCYVVGDEVHAEFESQFSYAGELFHEVFNSNSLHVRYPLLFLNQRAPGHGDPASETHLDLVEATIRQLQAGGLAPDHIEVIEGCTACDMTRFFSHRGEYGKTGRMMAAIGIKPGP